MKFHPWIVLAAAATLSYAVTSRADDYKLDPAHTHVGFTVNHMLTKVRGEFKDFDGAFSFDPAKPSAATGKFVVKTASVSTDAEKRDTHLKSGDFFGVEKFPEMTFDKIKVTQGKGKGKFKLSGELTLHGVTKPVTFDLEYAGTAKDPWGGTRAGFSASAKINRKDFGMVWNKALDTGGVLVGDEVKIDLDVEAVQGKPGDAKKS